MGGRGLVSWHGGLLPCAPAGTRSEEDRAGWVREFSEQAVYSRTACMGLVTRQWEGRGAPRAL